MSKYLYLHSKDLYAAPDGNTYTYEEVCKFDDMEMEWRTSLRQSLPNTITGYLKMFPEATRQARRAVKEQLKLYKFELVSINKQQEEYYDRWIAPAHFSEQEEIKIESDTWFDEKRKDVERKIRSAQFELSYINELEGKGVAKTGTGVSEGDIIRAKEVPIESVYPGHLHKHGRLAVGVCPFHKEKTGSFTVYLEQNSWFCFSCQKGGSVVDLMMQLRDVDFLSAVKKLIK